MTNLNEITYVDWQCKLNGIGDVAEGVEDINQCIAIILSTQKGSDPHRPTFGSDIIKYVDYPINIAKANIIRETIDALTLSTFSKTFFCDLLAPPEDFLTVPNVEPFPPKERVIKK